MTSSVPAKSRENTKTPVRARPFADTAEALVRKGWAPYPQTADDRRMPGVHRGEGIKWVTEHQLPEKTPSVRTVRAWAASNPDLNVAVALGPGSGDAIGIDIDVTDMDVVSDLLDKAATVIGETPLRRVGQEPKILLLFRQDPEDPVRNKGRKFDRERLPDQGIDILGQGKSATFFGRHHGTGQPFRWLESNPIQTSPDDLPVVSETQINQWLEIVDAHYPFNRNQTVDKGPDIEIDWEATNPETLQVPPINQGNAPDAWVEDTEGYVTDGREQYLYHLARVTVRLYPNASADAIAHTVRERFEETIDNSDGNPRWEGGRLEREVGDRVQRFKALLENGELAPLSPKKRSLRDQTREITTAPSPHGGKRPEIIDFLPTTEGRRSVPGRIEESGKERPSDPAEIDQAGVNTEVSAQLQNALSAFFDDIYPEWEAIGLSAPVGTRCVTSEHDTEVGRHPIRLDSRSGDLLVPESALNDNNGVRLDLRKRDGHNEQAKITITRSLTPPYIELTCQGPVRADGVADGTGDGTMRIRFNIDEPEGRARVHVLKAPTGSGKTTKTLEWIANDSRRDRPYPYRDNKGNLQYGKCPLVFLLPTYENIEELRDKAETLNIDPELPDEELAAEASRAGLVRSDAMADEIADVREKAAAAGLSTMVYSGKLTAGCQMADKVQMAMEAGIGTSALCAADVTNDAGERETRYCPYYEGCPYIEQRRQVPEADIVFLPHAFMSLEIPPELKNVRGVICDERIHQLFLHTTTLHQNTLFNDRPRPRPTKREYQDGITAEDLEQARGWVAERVFYAIGERRCPAAKIREDAQAEGHAPLELVKQAMRVCSSGLQRDGSVNPDITTDELREICNRPQGTEIREEYRLWAIIYERIEQLEQDAARDAAIAELERERGNADNDARQRVEERLAKLRAQPDAARGDHDVRIQPIIEEREREQVNLIRLSWRTEPNWLEKPLLLLDASAATEILRKIWRDRDVHEHRIDAPMRVRTVAIPDATYSNSAIVAPSTASFQKRVRSAQYLSKLRQAVSCLGSLFSDSRLLVGSSIIVRRAINANWTTPENVDYCHFGALRGLDFAKNHKAAMSIGRMEVPFRTIDGLAAALTYDDLEPERPFDRRGDGRNDDGEELALPTRERAIPMRSGHVFKTQIPVYPGYWASLLQDQYREQELLQFVGRLRPVYRSEIPVWFVLTSVLPENIILDDVIALPDLLSTGPSNPLLAEGARRLDGIIDPRLIHLVAPELFQDEKAVARTMRKAGFVDDEIDAESPTTKSKRANRAYVTCRWRTGHAPGRMKKAYVAAFKDDPVGHLRDKISEYYDVDPDEIQIELASRPVHASGTPRHADRIDEELGDRDQRRAGEEHVRMASVEYMANDNRVGERPPYYYRVGANDATNPSLMTPLDIDASQALADVRTWIEGVGPPAPGGVTDDRGDTYEHLGQTNEDDDELEDVPF